MLKLQRPFYLVLCMVAVIVGVKLYVYYIEQRQAEVVQKAEEQGVALEKAPLQQGKAVILEITFRPEHTKTVYYPAGKAKVKHQTYTVKDSYEAIFQIESIHEPVRYTGYDIMEGKKYKKGDSVQLNYKRLKLPSSSAQEIHVLDFKPYIKPEQE